MAYQHRLSRDFGHPFTREAGWDLLEVQADSSEQLDAYIAAAERKFWKVWNRRQAQRTWPAAVLYKPVDACVQWDDAPDATPASRMLEQVNMRAVQHHVDIALSTIGHHIRSASDEGQLHQRLQLAVIAYGTSGKASSDACAGLLGVVPLLESFFARATSVPAGVNWRQHAHDQHEALEAAVDDEKASVERAPTRTTSNAPRPRLGGRRARLS